jgi:hypothetical protein
LLVFLAISATRVQGLLLGTSEGVHLLTRAGCNLSASQNPSRGSGNKIQFPRYPRRRRSCLYLRSKDETDNPGERHGFFLLGFMFGHLLEAP